MVLEQGKVVVSSDNTHYTRCSALENRGPGSQSQSGEGSVNPARTVIDLAGDMNVRSHNNSQRLDHARIYMITAVRYVVLEHEELVHLVICEGSLEHGEDPEHPHENFGGEWVIS